MFGYIKEPNMEVTAMTIAGIWYNRVITKKDRETVWMKRETKSARKARQKERKKK